MTNPVLPLVKLLFAALLGLSVAVGGVFWALYFFHLITAECVVVGMAATVLTFGLGGVGIAVGMVPRFRRYHRHLNSLGATPRAAEGWAGPVDAAGALRRSRTLSPFRPVNRLAAQEHTK